MPAPGPLRRHADNPCRFADPTGRAVFLTGSHHWDSLQENAERPGGFDFALYLDRLTRWGHSFIRLWTHEAWTHSVSPQPWSRRGPGLAADGRPRFDLERPDGAYFQRLRERVAAAGERGLYVSVMLFNGWSIHDNGEGNPWPNHPFQRTNNVNHVDGDPAGVGDGRLVHTLQDPRITRLQEAYVERVVVALADQPHVLWEIANESPGESRAWQRHMMAHLRALERGRALAHPVGMTFAWPGGSNQDLFGSSADWVSPGRRGGWMESPPPAAGDKVVLVDTDHLWGIGGDRAWVWKTVLRGHQPIFMDPLDDDPQREATRRAMGAARRVAERLDLAEFRPAPRAASSGYCMVRQLPGGEALLAYFPPRRWPSFGGWLEPEIPGEIEIEWLDVDTGAVLRQEAAPASRRQRLRVAARAEALVLARRR